MDELQSSMFKVIKYYHTYKVKSIMANNINCDDPLHYGIRNGTELSQNHILSIILYCDWSELCKQFSQTFRSMSAFEPIEITVKRNGEYANWAQHLRETVEYFGKYGWDYDEDERWNEENDREKGPFYCGIGIEMVIPEFGIRLCSPTSTSKHLEVAARFGGEKGIIIQLNNNGHRTGWLLRSWDCSWLSNYGKQEDERLFIGGAWTIKLESVRIVKTKTNFERRFQPLFRFDCMVTGTFMQSKKRKTSKDAETIENLIKHKLKINGYKNEYDEYINLTFEAFTDHKTQIVINPVFMTHQFDDLYPLMMHKISTQTNKQIEINTKNDTNALNPTNIFKPVLFRLFKNVTQIIINSTQLNPDLYVQHSIDLLSLLRIIETAKISPKTIITIKATHEYEVSIPEKVETMEQCKIEYVSNSWISNTWRKHSELIKSKYNKQKYDILFVEKSVRFLDIWELKEDWLQISKSD